MQSLCYTFTNYSTPFSLCRVKQDLTQGYPNLDSVLVLITWLSSGQGPKWNIFRLRSLMKSIPLVRVPLPVSWEVLSFSGNLHPYPHKIHGMCEGTTKIFSLGRKGNLFLFFFLIRGIYYNLILFTWTLIKYRALQDLQPFILPHIFCCCNPPVVDTAKLIEPCMIFCKSKLLSHTGSKAPIEMSAHWNYNLMSSFLAAAFTYQLCLTAITESGRKKIY